MLIVSSLAVDKTNFSKSRHHLMKFFAYHHRCNANIQKQIVESEKEKNDELSEECVGENISKAKFKKQSRSFCATTVSFASCTSRKMIPN